MRSDARLNRERLIGSASALFAAAGVDAPLEAVAKDAGVGIGTLYRHFPTRAALLEAVYRQEVDRLCLAADELLAAHRPDEALELWLQRFVTYAATKRGLAAALGSIAASGAELYTTSRERLLTAVGKLLLAAIADGSVRSDMSPEDVFQAMTGVWLIPADERWQPRAERQLQLLMDGLRYGARYR
jgi:AcrR family transcriptional regulator